MQVPFAYRLLNRNSENVGSVNPANDGKVKYWFLHNRLLIAFLIAGIRTVIVQIAPTAFNWRLKRFAIGEVISS